MMQLPTKPTDLSREFSCRLLSSIPTIVMYYYSARKLIYIYRPADGRGLSRSIIAQHRHIGLFNSFRITYCFWILWRFWQIFGGGAVGAASMMALASCFSQFQCSTVLCLCSLAILYLTLRETSPATVIHPNQGTVVSTIRASHRTEWRIHTSGACTGRGHRYTKMRKRNWYILSNNFRLPKITI